MKLVLYDVIEQLKIAYVARKYTVLEKSAYIFNIINVLKIFTVPAFFRRSNMLTS